MATVTKPIALDETLHTTENPSRNIADVLAEELKGIADSITTAENVENILTDMATTKTAPTISGTAVFDTVDGNLVKSLKVAVTPSQDLNGYDHPWVGGAGKNKLDDSKYENFPISRYDITFIKNDDGSITINGTSTGSIVVDFITATAFTLPKGKYILSDNWNKDGNFGLFLSLWNGSTRVVQDLATTYGSGVVETVFDTEPYTYTGVQLGVYIPSGKTYNNYTIYPMIRLATESDSTFEPYSNICPISGHTQEAISVKDSTDTTQATYTTAFGQTVYGGTLDVLTGELAITYISVGASDFTNFYGTSTSAGGLHYAQIDSTGAKLNGNGICNIAEVNNAGAWSSTIPVAQISPNQAERIRFYCECTSMNEFLSQYANLQIVFELETPTTLSLTPQTVKALVGENHISASTGDVLECKFSMLINGDDLAILLS